MSTVEIQCDTKSYGNTTDNNQPRADRGLTNRNGQLVEKVRASILDLYAKDPQLGDPEDIERVKQDDWYIKRFLLTNGRNVKSTTVSLINNLKWRRANKFDITYFPGELYRLGGFFVYGQDKEGHDVIYVRASHFRRNKDLRPVLVQFGVAIGSRVEAKSVKGIVCVIDFKDLSLTHVDLEIMRMIITTIVNHFPLIVRRFYVLNVPSVLQIASSIVLSFIPSSGRNSVLFPNQKDLSKYIDLDNIPEFLGGTCKKPYKGNQVVPKGCPNFLEFAQRIGWNKDQYRQIYRTFKSVYESEGLEPMPEPVD